MKFHYSLGGGGLNFKPLPMYGNGTDINEGAVVVKGATNGTNDGFAIVGAPAYAGVLGVTTTKHTAGAAGSDSKEDGTAYGRKKIIINPDAVYLCEHSDPVTAAIAVASVGAATAGATVTITSLEAAIGGGWLWGSDGVLQYVTNNNSGGSCVIKSANAWTAATKVAKIERLFSILSDLNSTGDLLKNPVAAPTGKVIVLENYVQSPNSKREILDPTKHSGATFLYSAGCKVWSDILFQNHAFANIGAS